jgi:hypothetical protein
VIELMLMNTTYPSGRKERNGTSDPIRLNDSNGSDRTTGFGICVALISSRDTWGIGSENASWKDLFFTAVFD